MSAIMTSQSAALLRPTALSRSTAHTGSKRAKHLKRELAPRLLGVRAREGLEQQDVHDRKQLVCDWEKDHKPHGPSVFHLVLIGEDERSRPYAVEALRWTAEKLNLDLVERETRATNPAQLSLFSSAVWEAEG